MVRRAVDNDDILRAALNTLIVAVFSTMHGHAPRHAAGHRRRDPRRRKGRLLETLIFAPMIIPDIVLAIALLSMFSLIGVRMGLQTIIVSHVVFNLAFVCAVVRARLRTFDWSIVEASADLGASALTTLWRVIVPALMPAIIAGALLAFTLSVDEFIIAFFTAGAGRSSITLPMQIFAMIRFGVTPEINALATIVMLVSGRRAGPRAAAERRGLAGTMSATVPVDAQRSSRSTSAAVRAVDGRRSTSARTSSSRLLGPSGCGKTTLLRMIAGFDHADQWSGPPQRPST